MLIMASVHPPGRLTALGLLVATSLLTFGVYSIVGGACVIRIAGTNSTSIVRLGMRSGCDLDLGKRPDRCLLHHTSFNRPRRLSRWPAFSAARSSCSSRPGCISALSSLCSAVGLGGDGEWHFELAVRGDTNSQSAHGTWHPPPSAHARVNIICTCRCIC